MKKAESYKNPRPTTAVILENEKGEILLVRRARPPKKGWWDLPGGFIEFNETLEESAQREIKEELDISISHLLYVNSYYNLYLYKGNYYHILNFTLSAKLSQQKIIPKDDVASVRFFSKNAIPFKRLAFASIKKGLEEYLSSLHQSQKTVQPKQ